MNHDILDAWRYNKMFDWSPIPWIGYNGDTKYQRRCRQIRERLCEYNIKSRVSRHTLFDEEYYLVAISEDSCNYDKNSIKKLAEYIFLRFL